MSKRIYGQEPREYVTAFRTSALSRRQYARNAGVPESTLRDWEKRTIAPVKAAKPAVTPKRNKASDVDRYTTIMQELDTALGSIKTIKRILASL